MTEQLNLLNVESLIESSSAKLENIKGETKELKSMLDSILENDDEYQTLCEEINTRNKLKKIAKQKIMQRDEAKSLAERIKDGQCQIKELNTALSDYLSQYCILAETNQIEMKDGVVRQIIHSAKLVKSK